VELEAGTVREGDSMILLRAYSRIAAGFFLHAQASDYQGGEPPSMATAEHLKAINRMKGVLRPLGEADVYVRGMMAANSLPMLNQYAGLVHPPEELDVIARLAVGKKVHCVHDRGEPGAFGDRGPGLFSLPLGTIFAADRVREEGVEWTRFLFYAARTPITREVITRVDAGNISEVSVQEIYTWLECSLCRANIRKCDHVPGEGECLGIIHGVRDFVECSLVPEGAMQGTSLFDPSRLAAGGALAGEDTPAMLAARGSLALMFDAYEPQTLERFFTK